MNQRAKAMLLLYRLGRIGAAALEQAVADGVLTREQQTHIAAHGRIK